MAKKGKSLIEEHWDEVILYGGIALGLYLLSRLWEFYEMEQGKCIDCILDGNNNCSFQQYNTTMG